MLKNFTLLVLLTIFGLTFSSCKRETPQIIIPDPIDVYKGMDIYILMGQSNMSGRGVMATEDRIVENQKVLMLTKSLKWTPAKNPLHFDTGGAGVGPGLAFGLAMQQANKDIEIGLVPTAVGGTGIDVWQPGALDIETQTHPYDDAEKRIIEAMKSGTIKGILWHQGEEDSKQAYTTENYMPKLKTLVSRIRTLVGDPNLPFVVGELGRFKQNLIDFNKVIVKVPLEITHTAVASSDGLLDKGDNLHFNTASAKILGERYAEKMLFLQKK